MASVEDIGKAFNLSTKRVLSHLLDDFENITKDLFDNVAKAYAQKGRVNPTECVAKLVDQLIGKDDQIKTNIAIAMEQLEKHKLLKKIRDKIEKKEQEILQLQSQLKEAETILATAIFQASKKLEATEQAKEASVSCEELIKFAFRISTGSSVEAPPNWIPGDPRRPYPLDIEMRCGALGQLSQKGTEDDRSSVLNRVDSVDDFEKKKETQDSHPSRTGSTSSRNGGIWQGPPSDDVAHLATMPVSAMMSFPENGNTNVEEFMSTSSDSSSSGDSS